MAKQRIKALPPRIATLDTRAIQPRPKIVDPYYSSSVHIAWRDMVISRSNGFCQDRRCKTPGEPGLRLVADHIIELRDGGSRTDPSNGMARCWSCHTRKTVAERARRLAMT